MASCHQSKGGFSMSGKKGALRKIRKRRGFILSLQKIFPYSNIKVYKTYNFT